MAWRFSGESAAGSNVFPAPTSIFAKRAISSFSDGCVGQKPRAWLSWLKKASEVFSSSALFSGGSQLMAGAAGGAGCFRNCDSGWSL
jgi:hypothetical protein